MYIFIIHEVVHYIILKRVTYFTGTKCDWDLRVQKCVCFEDYIWSRDAPYVTPALLSTDGYFEIGFSPTRRKHHPARCKFIKKRLNIQRLVNSLFDQLSADQDEILIICILLIISGIEQNPGPGDERDQHEKKRFRKSGVRYKTYLTNRSSLENAPEHLQAVFQENIQEHPTTYAESSQVDNTSATSNLHDRMISDELMVDLSDNENIDQPWQNTDFFNEQTDTLDDNSDDNSDAESIAWVDSDEWLSESDEESISNSPIFETDFNNEPIYEGAQITLGESLLINMTFALTHNLTSKAFSDHLDTVRIHCKESNLLPSTVYELKKWYRNLKISQKKHYYCGDCLVSVGEHCDRCPNRKCNKSFTHSSDKSFFIEASLIEQLSQLYSEADFRKLLLKPAERSSADDSFQDIYDGELYKQCASNKGVISDFLTFTWNTDGVPLFKSSKTSMWPFFVCINELPFRIRRKPENLLLVGLWIGPKKPEMLTYLKPFINDFLELENGIKIETDIGVQKTLYGSLIAGTADLPAKCTVHNQTQFNGKYSCPQCEQPGETAKSGNGISHIFPFNFDGPTEPKRSHDRNIHHAEVATEQNKAEVGIKGPCWFAQCPSYDVIKSNCIDYMHCVLLGVTKRLINIWFSKENSSKPSSYYDKCSAVNKRLLNLKPPIFIRRAPRSFSDLKYWKASEFRSFLLFYGPVVLSDILSNSHYSHFLLLSEAIYILLKESLKQEDVLLAENLLENFIASFTTHYEKRLLTLNFHLLLHLPDNVRELGPIWAYSCFPFEDANGFLLKLVKGTQSVHSQLIDTMSIMHGLPFLEKTVVREGSEVDKLLKRIKHNDPKRITKLQREIWALGKMTKLDVDDLSQDCYTALANFIEGPPSGSVFKFKRIKLRGQVFHSTEYTRVKIRNSYTINYKENGNIKFGLVNYFLSFEPSEGNCCVLAFISNLSNNNDPTLNLQFPYDQMTDRYQMAHFKKFEIPGAHCQKQVVHVDSINGLCVNMKSPSKDLIYVCTPPNYVELE